MGSRWRDGCARGCWRNVFPSMLSISSDLSPETRRMNGAMWTLRSSVRLSEARGMMNPWRYDGFGAMSICGYRLFACIPMTLTTACSDSHRRSRNTASRCNVAHIGWVGKGARPVYGQRHGSAYKDASVLPNSSAADGPLPVTIFP